MWGARAVPAAFGAVVGALVFLLVHRALPDDGYITLNYARNLAEHGHWGLLADRPSNTATSPLNVWLLAAGIVVTGRPVVAVGLLLVVTLAVAAWWADGLRRELELSRALPYLVVALLGCSPLLQSTVGLETYLGATVLLGVARYAVAGRWVWTGVLVGAAVLTRPDLAVPAVVLALLVQQRTEAIGIARRAPDPSRGDRPAAGAQSFAPVPTPELSGPRRARSPAGWRSAAIVVAVATLVALPWHLFAWLELGGFLPDTAWFKSGDTWTVHGRVYRFADGWLLYAEDFTKATVLTLAPALAGLVAAVAWLMVGRRLPGRRAALGFAVAGVAHWVAFAALGTAPYAWYLAPSVVCLTVCACIAAAALPRPGLTRVAHVGTAVLVVGSAVFVLTWPTDLRPIVYNWASAPQYAAVGTDLARATRGEPVAASWEIGTTVYFCRCPLLDWFGDRAQTDQVIAARLAAAGPLTRAAARVNFAHREPTPPTPTRWRLGPGIVPDAFAVWSVDNPVKGPVWGSLTRTR